MHIPWVSWVLFLGLIGCLVNTVKGAPGVALPVSPPALDNTVPFTLARTPGSLPQHRIYVLNASVAGVPFEVVLDTGSSDLWIDTSDSEGAIAKDRIVETGRQITLQYGVDGAHTYARGAAEYADVQLGAGLTAYNQSFVNVPGTTNITKYGDKGILGLGPPGGWSVIRETLKGTEWATSPIFPTLLSQNPNMQPFFTLEFASRDSKGIVNNGTLAFGSLSLSIARVEDAPRLHLMTGSLWDVPSQGFVVNGEKINFSGSDDLPFALDTGAYTVCVPSDYMRAIYGSAPGSHLLSDGTWALPCDAKLNVSMAIGNATFPIHPIDMTEVYDVQDGQPLCRGLFRNNVDKRIPFLIGLNALRNMHILHSYGDRNGNEPYVQLVSITDADQASKEFDVMNVARVKSFMELRNASPDTQSMSWMTPWRGQIGTATYHSQLPIPSQLWSVGSLGLSKQRTLPRSKTMREDNLSTSRLFLQAVLLFTACAVVAFHSLLYRRCWFGRSRSSRNAVEFFQ